MAEDRVESREFSWRQWLPWTELFRGFRVALDPNKLVLAAAGILVMSIGWWFLAVLFFSAMPSKPMLGESPYVLDNAADSPADIWNRLKADRSSWNLMLQLAGPTDIDKKARRYDLVDVAGTHDEYKELEAAGLDKKTAAEADLARAKLRTDLAARAKVLGDQAIKPVGQMRTLPWFEDRGPNPYLLATGQAGVTADRRLPWEAGHGVEWFFGHQVPVLIEPLVKFLQPVIYFFHRDATNYVRLYLLCVLFWTLATWALFGGAITRIAAVEVARNEKPGLMEALRFAWKRYLHFLAAPALPLLLVAGIMLFLMVFGLFHMVPVLGDVIDGALWGLVLVLGLLMACVLVGLVSWPMMAATISAEDEEALNAVSRAYSYVIQAPWHYVWYCAVALSYGAVAVFFVGFMGSLAVNLAKLGVGLTTTSIFGLTSRDPAFLFLYAPTSFHWHELLLGASGVPTDLKWWNYLGAALVSVWLGAFFLLILGFGYSYFWSASTTIYLLMRKQVDDAEIDEVYLEEEEQDEYTSPPPAATAKPSAPPGVSVTMVEAPALRTSSPAPAPPPAAPPPPPPAPVVTPPMRTEVASTATAPPPLSANDGGKKAPTAEPTE